MGAEKYFERHQFAGAFNFERESSATTELDDSGRIDIAVARTTLGINSSWSYLLSDQVTLTASGGYADVSFEEAEGNNLTDYTFSNAGLNLRYRFSDRTNWLVNTSLTAFDTPAFEAGGQRIDGETTSYSIRIGFEHAFSETVDGTFLVGQNISSFQTETTRPVLISLFPFRVATQRLTQTGNDGGLLVNSSVLKRFEQGRLLVRWDRSFSASSQGSRADRQEIQGLGTYDLTYRWSARVDVRYREQEQETITNLIVRPIDTINLFGSVGYEITPQISVEFRYRFRHQSRPDLETIADSHRVGLARRYRGEAIPIFVKIHYSVRRNTVVERRTR